VGDDVTVAMRYFEQSATLEVRGGDPFVPATPREQLSALQTPLKIFEATA
jgi:hypothetical protein